MSRQAAILALAMFAAALPAGAAQVRETTSYFTVRGATMEEIDADLQRKGPVVGTAGSRHPGATSVSFDGHVAYANRDGRCVVDAVRLDLDLRITLPKWQSRAGAAPGTALIWRTISDDIARHEAEHAAIARQWTRRLQMALRNLAPQRNCDALEAKVNQTTTYYLRGHERAQREFDVREGREINYRLRRALDANIRAEEQRRADARDASGAAL